MTRINPAPSCGVFNPAGRCWINKAYIPYKGITPRPSAGGREVWPMKIQWSSVE